MRKEYTKATFKNFENIPETDIYQRSDIFTAYLNYSGYGNRQNYRVIAKHESSIDKKRHSHYSYAISGSS